MRAQTTLDFAIGVTTFLVVVLFLFAFVPGILEPFEVSGEQDVVLSDRLASRLSQDTLADPTAPFALDTVCTVRFFDESTSPPASCDYDGAELQERLRLPSHENLNVSIEGTLVGTDDDLICWDANDEKLVEADTVACGNHGDDQVLAVGSVPPSANDGTVTARRVVSLNRENVTVKVVVW